MTIDGEQMTAKQAQELVAEGQRAADSIWAHFRTRNGRRGEMAAMIAARNPGVPSTLWDGMVNGWLWEYRNLPANESPTRYLAYMGFDCIQ